MRRPRASPQRQGSSPLARGLRTSYASTGDGERIIPARAGFTPVRGGSRTAGVDHPRSRGVYLEAVRVHGNEVGSSPLARGLRGLGCAPSGAAGIIPARAGFTRGGWRSGPRHRDHPRSRGVYGYQPGSLGMSRGSSPLARGLPPSQNINSGSPRIIPARAGFTASPSPCSPSAGDHPRSRGVYTRRPTSKSSTWGSSPLARGLPHAHNAVMFNTLDHPRSRGVYKPTFLGRFFTTGSSPLARGLPGPVGPRRRARLDHPRSRGVYKARRWVSSTLNGSSPLARGLPPGP